MLAEITLQHIAICCLHVTSFSSECLLEGGGGCCFEDSMDSESLNVKKVIDMIILQQL